MDDETVAKAGTGGARALLDSAEDNLRRWLMEVDRLVAQSEDGDLPKVTEVSGTLSEILKVRRHIQDGIKHHERDVLHEENRIDTAPIDFDARRDEIGRRLARLRAVRDDG